MSAPLGFFAAEIAAAKPAGVALARSYGWGPLLWGALSLSLTTAGASTTIRASDAGYRTRATDPGGVLSYPPLLTGAFQIDREVALDPAGTGAAYGWGAIRLSNASGRFDDFDASWNVDRRSARVLFGRKTFDRANGLWVDPAYASLATLFAGLAGKWFLGVDGLEIPLRDPLSWLDAPLQAQLYAGTGTYEGPAALGGTPKPKARGGTAGNPIRNVSPVLIDPTNLIYQYTDGPGTVVALYEGGAQTIVSSGNTSNLYAGSTTAGHYRTDNARGLFQLGSVPAAGYAITADVTGAFPVAGAQTTLLSIARYLLTEDCAFPGASLNLSSFTALDAAYPYTAGVWYGPAPVDAATAIAQLFAGANLRLVPLRDGTCKAIALRVPTLSDPLVMAVTPAQIVSLTPVPLPDVVSPTPYRFRVAYQHNFTLQASGINTASATAAQQQFVTAEDRFATWFDAALLSAFARPNDPPPVASALLIAADAQAVANALGALFGKRRRIFEVELPLAVGLTADLGDGVILTYPSGDLRNGAPGLVIGDRVSSVAATMFLRVLV